MKRNAIALITAGFLCLAAPLSASAAAIWTVTATTGDGAPLNGATPGTRVFLDIQLRTTNPSGLTEITGSVSGYDTSAIAFNSAEIFSTEVFFEICIPSLACLGGTPNQESGVRSEFGLEGPGQEDTFLTIARTLPATSDGYADPTPQFRLVYDIIAPGAFSTVMNIGTFAEYGDYYVEDGGDNGVNNTAVSISVVPEPSVAILLGLGLAGLSARKRT